MRFLVQISLGHLFVGVAIAITVFTIYAPLAYGNPWTKSQCNSVKLFKTWDWDCNNFLDTVSPHTGSHFTFANAT